MKRVTTTFILAWMLLFTLPFTTGSAAPFINAEYDAGQNFTPGSIIQFEHLNIEDGLSQNAGLSIFQDSQGYLWIGTQDGLNRYDGYNFKIFKHDPDDPNSLSHNSILSIAEDNDGSLWVGTWGGGLNRYDPSTEKFTRYINDPKDPASLNDGTITSIKQDSKGSLWIGTLRGLDRYNPEKDGFDHFVYDFHDSNSLSSDAISVIMVAGLNNNEIAESLVVSLGTVKFHISNIFHKLGVDSRVEAVKLALEQKLA